jgi:hypothetical protein
MALSRDPNETIFQKTLAISDYYFGADDWEYPLGLIQMCATSHGAQISGEVLPQWLEWAPKMPFEAMARHSMDFWLSSEDLPLPENRVYYDGELSKRPFRCICGHQSALHRRSAQGHSRRGRETACIEVFGIHRLWVFYASRRLRRPEILNAPEPQSLGRCQPDLHVAGGHGRFRKH